MDFARGSIARTLAAAGCIAPEEEAAELIAAAGDDRLELAAMVAARAAGEPLAWLTGRTRFCGLTLAVAAGTYVPRPQTEPLARRAAELLPRGGTAVDLCTGVGAIAAVRPRPHRRPASSRPTSMRRRHAAPAATAST